MGTAVTDRPGTASAARASSLSTSSAWMKRKTRYAGRWSWSRTVRPPTIEIGYIDLRRKREAEKEEIPWFLHSFVNPPTDPLTIRLLALVEDLPSIPRPKTVGSKNYSRIFDAFMKLGWAGFEEEFDRIVLRDRADYADVKRNILCEPIFSVKAHRNMADAVLGRKTVDEIFDEMARKQEQKPQ